MSADVYVLDQVCEVVYVYPQQVHPGDTTSGGGGVRPRTMPIKPFVPDLECDPEKPWLCDEEDEAILMLMGVL